MELIARNGSKDKTTPLNVGNMMVVMVDDIGAVTTYSLPYGYNTNEDIAQAGSFDVGNLHKFDMEKITAGPDMPILFRPVIDLEEDQTENVEVIHSNIEYKQGAFLPLNDGFYIYTTTFEDHINQLERVAAGVSMPLTDGEPVKIFDEIYLIVDEFAEKRYFAMLSSDFGVFEVEIEAAKYDKDDEDDLAKYEALPEEDKDPNLLLDKVIGTLYDAEANEYINNHIAVVNGKFVSINPEDVIYKCRVVDLEERHPIAEVYTGE